MHGLLWLGRPGIDKGLVVLLGVSDRMLVVLPSLSGLPWREMHRESHLGF